MPGKRVNNIKIVRCVMCNGEAIQKTKKVTLYCGSNCKELARRRKNGIKPPPTVLERFWNCVEHEPNTGCWLWSGPTAGKGYGVIGVSSKQKYTHRFSYELHFGEIPSGLLVRHKCDIPLCVNPSHLIVGTYLDNSNDMVLRKRRKYDGENNPRSILSLDDVLEIKSLFGKKKVPSIAKIYGVSAATIRSIKYGSNWRGVE